VGESRVRVELAPGVIVPMVKQAIEGLADAEKKSDDAKKDDKADADGGRKKKKK